MANRILRAPARIVLNPNNLAADAPFGGVFVGRAREVAMVEQGGTGRRIDAELLGEATDVLEGPNVTSFGCFLRGWNDDAVEQFLADGYTVGSGTGRATYTSPGSRVPGQTAVDRSVTLLVLPDNPDDAPALLLHRFLPFWDQEATLAWSRQSELGIPLAGECLRGANGRIFDIARLADLSLS